MAYIVPKEPPKSCHDCPFHYCSEYHPFWSADREKRNTQTIRCQAIEPFRSTILSIEDKTFKADWCPLVDVSAFAGEIFAEIGRKLTCTNEEDYRVFCELREKYVGGATDE